MTNEMSKILIIAKKEIKELLQDKGTLLTGLGFALFFSIFRSLAIIRMEASVAATSLDSAVFYLSASVGFFIVYVYVSQAFMREKVDRVIETLMCTPINLRQIWLGKVLGVTIPSYILSLLTVLVIIVTSNVAVDSASWRFPSPAVLVHILLAVPVFIAAFAGMLGFSHLLLGMRENRILNLLIFMPAFVVLYSTGFAASSSLSISWIQVGMLFAIYMLILSVTAYLTRFLSKERIVTTLL